MPSEFGCARCATSRVIWLFWEYLIAFPNKFEKICRRRVLSPKTNFGPCNAQDKTSLFPNFIAAPSRLRSSSSNIPGKSKGRGSSVTLPDSKLDRSRTSLTRVNSKSPEKRIASIYDFCLSDRSGRASRSSDPNIPFKGVRISWLITAINFDLARSLAWAASRA